MGENQVRGGAVVAGVDGSESGVQAVRWAAAEASRRHLLLRLEREVLAERLAGWSEKYPEVSVRRLVVRDRPARALVEESGRAQLVVVGARGRGGFRGMLLGSVSQALLHHSHCPVAVVRPTGHGDHRPDRSALRDR
jgi:hypothetical protein